MDEEMLARRFEEHRTHLKAVAYRMLGSLSEAEDAVQEAWFRLSRTGAGGIDNLGGWLTTVVGRICLDQLRSRKVRGEESFGDRLPDPIVSTGDQPDPEHEVLMADSVGLALLVVLENLGPAERLAFVLHDMFGVPFDEIAPIVDKSPQATRQLASRARKRVQAGAPAPDPDLARQRAAVTAFLSAAREGDFEALVAVLDPDVVLRTDVGAGELKVIRGAATVAGQALTFRRNSPYTVPVLVNGVAGMLALPAGRAAAVGAFTVRDGRIVAIDILADEERLSALGLGSVRG